MSGVQSLHSDSLSESAWERIVRACDRYEDAWRAGRRPRIEDVSDEVSEPERSVLLRELLLLEVGVPAPSARIPVLRSSMAV
jgi:serine/threonine-protein kinase